MRLIPLVVMSLGLSVSLPAFAEEPAASPAPAEKPEGTKEDPKDQKKVEICEPHGVKKTLCTRCNAKLEPIFKKKGDWCEEHKRAESQCAVCNPDLAKQGVK